MDHPATARVKIMRAITKPNNSIHPPLLPNTTLAHKTLQAAVLGNLRQLKKLGKEMADGRGMSETIASVRDPNGLGVVHYAARKGRTNVCKYWVEDLKLPVDDKDHEGFTPFLHTSFGGHLGTMQYLVENGADLAPTNNYNTTALHNSAANGHVEMMNYLLSKGIDVNSLNAFGTPLEVAAQYGERDALKYLLDHGADPNLVLLNASPLVMALLESLECAKLLIQGGADPNGISRGRTPLTFAATGEKVEVIKFLLEAGADPNISDDTGLTPIESAARSGFHDNVKILFPVTAPIPACSDWSISGIMEHVKSEDFKHQVNLRCKEQYLNEKSNGDDALRRKDYLQASIHYSLAIEEEPSDATLFSIRSLCFVLIGDGDNALSDAEACIKLRPDWPEAYYRQGVALTLLGELDEATNAFLLGLKKDPKNKDLREAFRQAVEAKLNSFDI